MDRDPQVGGRMRDGPNVYRHFPSELYLSRVRLNLAHSRHVGRDVLNPYEMHRTVETLFDEPRVPIGHPRVLWRLEQDVARGRAYLWVQAPQRPNFRRLPDGYLVTEEDPYGFNTVEAIQIKPIQDVLRRLREGQVLRFLLYAGVEADGGKRRAGRRRPYEQPIAWLLRREEPCGFKICSAGGMPDVSYIERTLRGVKVIMDPKTTMRIVRTAILYEGLMVVTVPERLASAVACGVGGSLALGAGLLSLASA
jgi:hypothetical protein